MIFPESAKHQINPGEDNKKMTMREPHAWFLGCALTTNMDDTVSTGLPEVFVTIVQKDTYENRIRSPFI